MPGIETATRKDHLEEIREEVIQRAYLGSTLFDINRWLESNGFDEAERRHGRRLAKLYVHRARRKRVEGLLANLKR